MCELAKCNVRADTSLPPTSYLNIYTNLITNALRRAGHRVTYDAIRWTLFELETWHISL